MRDESWSRSAALVTLVLAVAMQRCGRSELDDGPNTLDAAVSDEGDAESTHPSCDPMSPFTSIAPLTIDTDEFDESDIRFTPDELTAYFTSNRAKQPGWGNDAFVAHRASLTAPFSTPIILPGIANPNSSAEDPNPTPDNLDLFFEGGCTDVFLHHLMLCGAHRNTADGAFDKPFIIHVGVDGPATFEGDVYTIHAGAIAYFMATNLNGHTRIARAARTGVGGFGVIEEVPIEGAPAFTFTPVVSEDETVLFFGGWQLRTNGIWVATRQDTSKPFTNVHVVAELPNDATVYPNWVSPDGCRLYFTRELESEGGSQTDVFVASR